MTLASWAISSLRLRVARCTVCSNFTGLLMSLKMSTVLMRGMLVPSLIMSLATIQRAVERCIGCCRTVADSTVTAASPNNLLMRSAMAQGIEAIVFRRTNDHQDCRPIIADLPVKSVLA